MDLSGSHILYATYCTVISSKMKDNTNTYYMDLSESQNCTYRAGCETWVVKHSHLRALTSFHNRCKYVRTRTMTMCGKNLRHCRGHKISTHSILERLGILPLTWSSTHDSCAFYTVLLCCFRTTHPGLFNNNNNHIRMRWILYVRRWYQISNSKRGCIIWQSLCFWLRFPFIFLSFHVTLDDSAIFSHLYY